MVEAQILEANQVGFIVRYIALNFVVLRPSQILLTFENRKSVDISDHLGKSGMNRENRELFYFPDTS